MKEKEQKKEKRYFDVVIEAQVPCVLKYRVYSESAEQAILDAKKESPKSIKHLINLKRDSVTTVYESGSTIVQFIKRWLR